MSPEVPARVAYHAYGSVTDWKNYQGNPMPEFDNLPPKIREAWEAFASRVLAGGEAADGYQAYGDVVGWVNFQGLPMPKWAEAPMTPKVIEAFQAAQASLA